MARRPLPPGPKAEEGSGDSPGLLLPAALQLLCTLALCHCHQQTKRAAHLALDPKPPLPQDLQQPCASKGFLRDKQTALQRIVPIHAAFLKVFQMFYFAPMAAQKLPPAFPKGRRRKKSPAAKTFVKTSRFSHLGGWKKNSPKEGRFAESCQECRAGRAVCSASPPAGAEAGPGCLCRALPETPEDWQRERPTGVGGMSCQPDTHGPKAPRGSEGGPGQACGRGKPQQNGLASGGRGGVAVLSAAWEAGQAASGETQGLLTALLPGEAVGKRFAISNN